MSVIVVSGVEKDQWGEQEEQIEEDGEFSEMGGNQFSQHLTEHTWLGILFVQHLHLQSTLQPSPLRQKQRFQTTCLYS